MRRLWYRGILQPGDRRLASQIKGAFGQAFQNCFEQRVRAVLVLVSGGYLVEALPKQHEQGVVYRGRTARGRGRRTPRTARAPRRSSPAYESFV